MVVTTGTRRMWPVRDVGPLTDAYSLTSDWDNQWLTGGLEPDVIAEAHLDKESIFNGILRFAGDHNERLARSGFPNVQLAYDGLQFEVQVDPAQEAEPEPHAVETRGVKLAAARPTRLSSFNSSQAWAARYASHGHRSVLAIGNFDGIHLGHQAILRATVERAKTLHAVATALTFDPSPRKVLRPESAPPRLSTNTQRMDWFSVVGLEAAVVLPFTLELAALSPEEFVTGILVRDLQVTAVLVGQNFRFGHKQAGDVHLLAELGQKYGFEVVIIPPVVYRGEVVSSTIIRREITEGDVAHAARLLGRPFVLTGEVVVGSGTGRRFTFPTLNIACDQELLPGRGVYITRTSLEGGTHSYRSVTNIGMRPTFNGSALSVETHMLNLQLDTPPKRIEVRFWKRLREERKFNSPEKLRAQIARDIAKADKFFSRLRYFRQIRQPV
jgi:riboflavin kinase/FMN adenylyltransferase